jgi:D-alanyl-D-alanine carboxypeptidase
MRKLFFVFVILINSSSVSFSQYDNFEAKLDSLLDLNKTEGFNGIIMAQTGSRVLTQKGYGYSSLENKTLFQATDQFVVGSISKQFTAVLVLMEIELGRLELSDSIIKYLPNLKQDWAKQVTLHNLLVHDHGIVNIEQPLSFQPGTQFKYSQLGYQLLAEILENLNEKSFQDQARELFVRCGMMNTFHPDAPEAKFVIQGYSESKEGKLLHEDESFMNYPAAGSFVSTVEDLILWNQHLHHGLILNEKTYELMNQVYQERKHILFGNLLYGYGTTFKTNESNNCLGLVGYAPGFISACYYFPELDLSFVMLSNVVRHPADLQKTFEYHLKALDYIKTY